MDNYWSKAPDNYKLIRNIFLFIATAIGMAISMLFLLELDLTANAFQGEIIAQNAPTKYLSPFDAQVAEVRVQEGTKVQKGDTLVVLHNDLLWKDYMDNKKRLEETTMNISIYEQKLQNISQKKTQQSSEINLIENKYLQEQALNKYNISQLNNQLANLESKLSLLEDRLEKDKQLLNEGLISEQNFNQSYQIYLEEKNKIAILKNEFFQKNNQPIQQELEERKHQQRLASLNLESEYLQLTQLLQQEKSEQQRLQALNEIHQKDISKQYIIASENGFASQLFNTENIVKIVAKNQTLLILTSNKDSQYYAKLKVNEEELKDIKVGQLVHLKLDAFNHYQYGVLKAKVTHIDFENTDMDNQEDSFYILAELKEHSDKINIKRGLRVSGDIILGNVKLYQFVLNSLFKKL